jgi:hypothetical protein
MPKFERLPDPPRRKRGRKPVPVNPPIAKLKTAIIEPVGEQYGIRGLPERFPTAWEAIAEAAYCVDAGTPRPQSAYRLA